LQKRGKFKYSKNKKKIRKINKNFKKFIGATKMKNQKSCPMCEYQTNVPEEFCPDCGENLQDN